MATFAEQRKKNANRIENLRNKASTASGRKNNDFKVDDETYFDLKHLVDEEGKGTAKIRFLPASDGESEPWVFWEEYSKKGRNGSWYINRNRRSLSSDLKDPAYEYNGTVFDRARDGEITDAEKKRLLMDRRKTYVTNIYVISDKKNPDNVGKVFKFKFGHQIWNMIDAQLNPKFEEDPSIDVFDPFEGADFIIRVAPKVIPKSDGNGTTTVPSYEDSKFDKPSAFVDEDEFEEIWKQQYKLSELNTEKDYKSYEQLKKELDKVLGVSNDEEDLPEDKPKDKVTTKPKEAVSKRTTEEDIDDEIPFGNVEDIGTKKNVSKVVDDDDDDDWFNKLKK